MANKAVKKQQKLIHLTKEQEERMAQQNAQRIQAFANELSQVQSRRLELAGALLVAHVTKTGLPSAINDGLAAAEIAQAIANEAVRVDSVQKWNDIKAMFAELGVDGPQAPLEWAAKKVGVTLFDEPAEESLIQPATVESLIEVVNH